MSQGDDASSGAPSISRALLDSYLTATYAVLTSPQMMLHIGVQSPALQDLHKQFGVTSSCLITAFNPFGELTGDAANSRAQQKLELELRDGALSFLPAEGRAKDGAWPAEPGVLVLGIDPNAARRLCVAHRQNAIVFCLEDCIPRLLLHPQGLLGS